MKSIYYFFLFSLCALALTFFACTLDKEPTIPIGATNEKAPVFLSTSLTAITHDSIRAKARLSSRGNLNILRHGWVWSENPKPTLQDDTLGLGMLGIDSFETLIPGLILGKTYHFRPYVVTGSGETYGLRKPFLWAYQRRLDNIALAADSACFLRVQCSVQSPMPPVEYGIVYLKGAGTPTLQKNDGHVPGTGLDNDDFQADLTMLTPNTTYSLRAYAVTASGPGYSQMLPVTTPSSPLLVANFSINTDAEIFQGADVLFTNASAGANAYSWDFGDGQTSSDLSPLHTFNTLGSMTVRLTVSNGGCSITKDTMLKTIIDPFLDYWKEIPGGTFMMGCTPEQTPFCNGEDKPVHQVILNSFYIGKTEITQGQWQKVLGNNPSFFWQCGLDCPVEFVSWDRIKEQFIPALYRKTGRIYRLPTEAEWEYAARSGTDFIYAGSNDPGLVACYDPNCSAIVGPCPVQQLVPNGNLLYDMTGNVAEWVEDDAHNNYNGAPTDGSAGLTAQEACTV